jgi:hypothetical protein
MGEISSKAPRSGAADRTGARDASDDAADVAARSCKVDFSTMCPTCQVEMQPVHSHYQCTRCGWRDSCCF